MKTTEFYVELIVIGLETALCLLCIALCFGIIQPETAFNFFNTMSSLTGVIFGVGILYLLGLFSDRICDFICDPLESHLRRNFVSWHEIDPTENAKLSGKCPLSGISLSFTFYSNGYKDIHHWMRSRLRILRASALLIFLSALSLTGYFIQVRNIGQALLILFIGLGVVTLSCLSYIKMLKRYHRMAYMILLEKEEGKKTTLIMEP